MRARAGGGGGGTGQRCGWRTHVTLQSLGQSVDDFKAAAGQVYPDLDGDDVEYVTVCVLCVCVRFVGLGV